MYTQSTVPGQWWMMDSFLYPINFGETGYQYRGKQADSNFIMYSKLYSRWTESLCRINKKTTKIVYWLYDEKDFINNEKIILKHWEI